MKMAEKRITQYEILEIIEGLKNVSESLQEAASSKLLENYKEAVVAAKVIALVRHAEFLGVTAENLMRLIPDTPIKSLPKE